MLMEAIAMVAVRRAAACAMPRGSALTGHRRAYFTPSLSPLLQKRYRGTAQQATTAGDAVNPLTKPSHIDKGALHLVSVPIGNLKDFSLRSLEVLRQVDYIVCVNRQATRQLLELVDVDCSGKLIHYRPNNGNDKLIEMLRGGRSMALVAPSGTPCIGDGGGDLVREMLSGGVRVTSVPGPSAVISALSVSGAMSKAEGPFFFGGTLPERSGPRVRQLRKAAAMGCPCVFYEFPRRLLFTLTDICRVMPTRVVSIVHEVTKVHESLHRDTAEKLLVYYSRGEMLQLISKGQVVVVIDGLEGVEDALNAESRTAQEALYHQLVARELSVTGGDVWAASKLVALAIDAPPNAVFEGYREHEAALTKAAMSSAPKPVKRRLRRSERIRRKRIRQRAHLIRKIEEKQELIRLSMVPKQP